MSEIDDALASRALFAVECSRAEDFAARLPDGCASMLWCDIPYHGAIDAAWDNQWATDDAFLAWVGGLCEGWRRILAPNGSIYVFASPAMAWAVEGVVREHFDVLTNIRWMKPAHSTKAEMFVKEDLRAPFPASETVLFCEQRGSDNIAMGISGYDAGTVDAKQEVFGRAFGDYLRAEFTRAGVTNRDVAMLFPSKTGGLTGCVSNWLAGSNRPTEEQYDTIRSFLSGRCSGAVLDRSYKSLCDEHESLRSKFEEERASLAPLKARYEALRRPFFATPERPYTDVWTYPTVPHYEGKHPCEKPYPMCEDAVLLSTRPGDLVVDLFCGAGGIGSAAVANGRRFIGGDMDKHWADFTRRRCEMTKATGQTTVRKVTKPAPGQRSLLDV